MTEAEQQPAAARISQAIARIDAITDGARATDTIGTGFPSVDKLLGGGVRRGDLIVLGGDVGSGKSALALAIALRAAQAGEAVLFFTGEMAPERVIERALAIEGRARIDDLRSGGVSEETRAALGVAALRFRDAMPGIERIAPAGIDPLAEAVRSARDAALVVIDSLQSIPIGNRPQAEEIAHSARVLKSAAVDANVAVIATAHLPAHTRDRSDPRPVLDDFGALGAVKQHADVVLAIFREDMYGTDGANEGATELAVLKNRNGATSYVDLFFYKQWLRFEDMIDPDK